MDALLAATGDLSLEIVREALRRLAMIGGPGAAQVLRWRIWRADPSLVEDFARCIAALGDRDAVEEALPTIRARGRDGRVYGERIAALALLGAFADPASVATIRDALEDPMAAVRQKALGVLRRFPADELTEHALIARLADSDPQVRATAVASVHTACWDAGGALSRLVGDESTLVRSALGRVAARLDGEASRLLLEDREIRVRELAAEHAGTSAVEPLAEAMRRDTSRPVRQAAARRLGELNATQASAALIDALADADSLVRVTALRSLQSIHGSAVARLLLEAVRGHVCQTRAGVVYALGRLGASGELAALRDDPDPTVQSALAFVTRESHAGPPRRTSDSRRPIHEEVAR